MQSSSSFAQAPTPKSGGPTDPSHDDRLRRGMIDTAVSRQVAVVMVSLFVALIAGVPVAQAVAEKVKGEDSMLTDVFRHPPEKERLRQFEKDLEEASYAKDFTQPRMQLFLSRVGRVGNKSAVIGRDGWLYYKPGVMSVGGPFFLDPEVIAGREKGALDSGDSAIHADPRPAIFAFAKMLEERGIKLVLFPVPDKAMLAPRELHGRGDPRSSARVPHNGSWEPFADEVRASGVAVLDPSPAWLSPDDPPRFLVQDTHWTPAWMEQVALELAHLVIQTAELPAALATPALHSVSQEVKRVGDLVDMLKLPEGQSAFAPNAVTIHQVQDETGAPWEADPKGDVLLLGDSFTNVFSLEPMGWGEAAGLAPHLALALGRPVDVIAQNDSGAYATRQALARELSAGEDRLAGKRVVIWEFASRELAVGDWRPIIWTAGPEAPSPEGAQ